MCLHAVSKRFSPPDQTVRKAWKYVVQDGDKLRSVYMSSVYSTEWQSAERFDLLTSDHNNRTNYESGFHVFATREDARKARRALNAVKGVFSRMQNLKLVKVEVKGVTTEGFDGTSIGSTYLDAKIKTLVADEMRVITVVED